MTADRQPKTISSMINALKKIRKDLFHLQGQLEKLERGEERLRDEVAPKPAFFRSVPATLIKDDS
jgi:hypothetical protein